MALEVYFIGGSPYAWRVMLGLALKGLEYKAIELHASKGEHKTPEYLAKNPRGKVPVLKDGELTMYESLAILAYLDRKYPEAPLFGASPEEAALVWQRTMEVESYLLPVISGIARPIFTGAIEGQEEAINEHIIVLKAELERYSEWLDGQDFLAGNVPGAADFTLYPPLALLSRVVGALQNDKIDTGFLPITGSFPALAAWMARIEAIDGFDTTYPPHWREAKAAE